MLCRKKSNPIIGAARVSKRYVNRSFTVAAPIAALLGTLGAQATRSVWDGVYTQEQAARGQVLYANLCSACHGLALNGGESAPPLSGGEFLSNWSGLTVGDLFERIRVSMPADNPGHLSRQQNADIIAHIFNVNQFPPGKTELDTRTEVLKQIAVESAKPDEKK
jgi:S-disulfanyl-L-cysteine oxidoreductase SoxD